MKKDQTKIIYCDECKREFEYRSIQIKETSVEIDGNVLLLDYFTCPFCNAVYKVLLVEEAKYRELVDDLVSVQKRIRRQNGKGNLMLMQKLQDMVQKKQERIKAYVDGISNQYPGSFILATKNNQNGEQIIYREKHGTKGENKNA